MAPAIKSGRNIWHPRFFGIWRGLRGTYGTRVSLGSQYIAPAFLRDSAGPAWNIWHPRFCGVTTYGTCVSAGFRGACVEHMALAFLWDRDIRHPHFCGSPGALRGTYGTRVCLGFGGARVEHMAPAFRRGSAGTRRKYGTRVCAPFCVDLSPNSSATFKTAGSKQFVAIIALKTIHK